MTAETVVALDGDVDLASIGALRRRLAVATDDRGTIVVDCAAVRTIDANSLAVLVGVQRRARDDGRRLTLRNVGPITKAVLVRSGLGLVLEIEEPTATIA